MTTPQRAAPVLKGALLGALAAVLLLSGPNPGSAQGAGTSFLACRDRAWSDYNECLSRDYNSKLTQIACFLAWDLDNVSCDIRLFKDMLRD